MAREQSPAFQFYPRDFLTDGNVATMTLAERGAYITLLCLCWQEQSLPFEHKKLARVVGVSMAAWIKIWPALSPCFSITQGRLSHPRLDREREKQAIFREQRSTAGKNSATRRQRAFNETPTDVQRESNSPSPSPISSLLVLQKTEGRADARSKRPIFTGQRFVVFEWQLDDLMRILGAHAEDFRLDEWFFALDQQAVHSGLVIPQRDGGQWLQAQTLAEARRRGLPIATAVPPEQQFGKQTTRLMAALANLSDERPA